LKIAFLRHFLLAKLKIFFYSRSLEPALKQLRMEGAIGFVPTMGALHEGHLALVQAARAAGCLPVASIFVNPRQFNNPEDLRLYPRSTAEDLALLSAAGCEAVFLPDPAEVYPAGADIPETPLGELENRFEGSFRPGHFRGVTEVLHRLFSLVKPDYAFFGEKDFQQCAVVETLVQQHFHSIRLQRVPTLREPNGLAMSSRNRRLSAAGREKAAAIYQALQRAAAGRNDGTAPASAIENASALLKNAGIETEYFALADPQSLATLHEWPQREAVLLFAGYLEGVRLIDNIRC
jgi:pantoate--beta-alanine ligase